MSMLHDLEDFTCKIQKSKRQTSGEITQREGPAANHRLLVKTGYPLLITRTRPYGMNTATACVSSIHLHIQTPVGVERILDGSKGVEVVVVQWLSYIRTQALGWSTLRIFSLCRSVLIPRLQAFGTLSACTGVQRRLRCGRGTCSPRLMTSTFQGASCERSFP
jgi:hypothetical protein